MFETLESVATFAINLFYTAVTYNFYFRKDEVKNIIDLLQSIVYSKLEYKNGCHKAIQYSKNIKIITFSLGLFTALATVLFMTVPFLYYSKIDIGKNTTVRRPLPYHSWYPYDTNKSPYYEISFTLEFFRGIGILSIVTGNDGLFTLILFNTFGQYEILCDNIENIFKTARNRLKMRYENFNEKNDEYKFLIYKEAKYLLKENIQHHNILNE